MGKAADGDFLAERAQPHSSTSSASICARVTPCSGLGLRVQGVPLSTIIGPPPIGGRSAYCGMRADRCSALCAGQNPSAGLAGGVPQSALCAPPRNPDACLRDERAVYFRADDIAPLECLTRFTPARCSPRHFHEEYVVNTPTGAQRYRYHGSSHVAGGARWC